MIRNPLILTAAFLLASPALAQSIDFETLPDGTPTTDRQLISDQYVAAFGVRFDLVDPITLEVVGSPQIAKVGNPQTAFTACGPDIPNPGLGTGDSFLTDDGVLNTAADTLLLTYSDPVAQAAGVILDTDTRSGPTYEEWTVEALDESMNVLETVVLTAPDGPDNCNSGQGPGDGAADAFVFDRPSADIKFIVLRYTGTATSIGLAFDTFSPTQIPPPPTAMLFGDDTDPCTYDRTFMTPVVTDGLAPFVYQWQQAAPMGPFVTIPGALDPVLQAPALPGYSFRAIVTDTLARQTTTNPVTLSSLSTPQITLSVETAAQSGEFDVLSTDVTPFLSGSDIETVYAWSDADPYYHGPDPALTLDRSHLFLSVGVKGHSLVTVHDIVGTNGDGRAEMRMSFTGLTPNFTAKDDPTSDAYLGDGTATLRTRHIWDSPNTDGWAIGALEGNWTADTIFFDGFSGANIQGLTSWAFYSGDGSIYTLPLEEDRIVRLESVCYCVADLNTDGAIDFLDISAFLSAYSSSDPLADLNNDGQYDFLDISIFLSVYSTGCP